MQHVVLEQLFEAQIQQAVDEDGTANDELRIGISRQDEFSGFVSGFEIGFLTVCVTQHGIGTHYVNETLDAAEEVRSLVAHCIPGNVFKFFHAGTGSAGKHENGLADVMDELTFLEFAILHGGQEVTQPGQVLAVELIPEHQRGLAGERDVAHGVERLVKLRGIIHIELGKVEGNILDLLVGQIK